MTAIKIFGDCCYDDPFWNKH